MDRRALLVAAVVGIPPGAGVGVALISVTRGDALVAGTVTGIIGATLLTGAIYLLGSRGSVADDHGTELPE